MLKTHGDKDPTKGFIPKLAGPLVQSGIELLETLSYSDFISSS